MHPKKTSETVNYNCCHFSGKTGNIAKLRLSAMLQTDKKKFHTTFTNKTD